MDPESCLKNIRFPYSKLMVALFEVYIRETSSTVKLIENFINSRKRILILDGKFVQLMVIYTHPKGTIILTQKKVGVPSGETLYRIKPFSRRSFNCSSSSFNSIGGIDTGRVS